jgi:hypothetical protein
VKLAAGGIKGPLLLFCADAVDQRAALVVDYIEEDLFNVLLSQRRVLVQIPDNLSAQHPKMIDVLLNGLRRQIRGPNQVFQEGPEAGYQPLAREQIFFLSHPGAWPIVQATAVTLHIRG